MFPTRWHMSAKPHTWSEWVSAGNLIRGMVTDRNRETPITNPSNAKQTVLSCSTSAAAAIAWYLALFWIYLHRKPDIDVKRENRHSEKSEWKRQTHDSMIKLHSRREITKLHNRIDTIRISAFFPAVRLFSLVIESQRTVAVNSPLPVWYVSNWLPRSMQVPSSPSLNARLHKLFILMESIHLLLLTRSTISDLFLFVSFFYYFVAPSRQVFRSFHLCPFVLLTYVTSFRCESAVRALNAGAACWHTVEIFIWNLHSCSRGEHSQRANYNNFLHVVRLHVEETTEMTPDRSCHRQRQFFTWHFCCCFHFAGRWKKKHSTWKIGSFVSAARRRSYVWH